MLMIPQATKRIGHRKDNYDINKYLLRGEKEIFRYTPLTYLNMKSMTLGNLENFLKQKNKKTKKYKKVGIFALLDV